jgi:hypothetical protein
MSIEEQFFCGFSGADNLPRSCPPEKSQLTIIERHGSFFAVNKWLALHMGPYRPNFLPVIVF